MENKLFDIKSNKEIKKYNLTEIELKDLFESSYSMLGFKLIKSNYSITSDNSNVISSLFIDDCFNLCVVEYRVNRFGRLINKGLMQIDYIKEHISEFKMLCHDCFGDIANSVNYDPRLIIIGESFNDFDYYSIKKLPYNISLIKVDYYKKSVGFTKQYVSRKVNLSLFNASFSEADKQIYKELQDFILSLSDTIELIGFKNYINVIGLKNFMNIVFDNGIKVYINGKVKDLKSLNDLEKVYKSIEEEYAK